MLAILGFFVGDSGRTITEGEDSSCEGGRELKLDIYFEDKLILNIFFVGSDLYSPSDSVEKIALLLFKERFVYYKFDPKIRH